MKKHDDDLDPEVKNFIVTGQQMPGYADGGIIDPNDSLDIPTEPQNPSIMDQFKKALSAPTAPSTPSYEDQAKDILKTSPEALLNQYKALQKPTGSSVTAGLLSGLGQGLARSGGDSGANFVNDTEKARQDKINAQMDISKLEPSMGKETFELSQKLQTQDPNSPISKSAQAANQALFQKMGFSPEQVARMPASLIEQITGHAVKEEENILKAKELGLGVTRAGIERDRVTSEVTHQREDEKNKHLEEAEAAYKNELASRGIVSKTFSTEAGNSREHERYIRDYMAKHHAQDLEGTSPSSQPKTVSQNGHTYVLNEATGKYE